ncbi:meckelin [Drosophila willistoni]|nr:meckelin [Drosophila willistoni]
MCFPLKTRFFQLLWTLIFLKIGNCSVTQQTPHTFRFQNPSQCLKNDNYYNLNYFDCMPCNEAGDVEKLQPTADKFSCQCPSSHISIYEKGKLWPNCDEICSTLTDRKENCTSVWLPQPRPSNSCSFRYLNSTSAYLRQMPIHPMIVGIVLTTSVNPDSNISDCHSCDLIYNYQYQGYCLANVLLRPYLHYNSFWQSTTNSKPSLNNNIAHNFGELKFVAFFCLALRNTTACQQLANLCVLSHFSPDKHSPCSPFILTQMSDVVMKYAHSGEQLRSLQPFLFYKKGKATRDLLSKTLQRSNVHELQLFSTTYNLAGSLKRWGTFSLEHVNLCQQPAPNLHFGQKQTDVSCHLTLEELIDLAGQQGNDNFLSVYLNFTSNWQFLLHQLPVLIENLTPENQREQRDEWQLVKRFQMISTVSTNSHQQQSVLNRYEDAHKLQLYRSIRYIEHLELHYTVEEDQRVGLPLIRVRYRLIELAGGNVSLSQSFPFQLKLSYERLQRSWDWLILEIALPLLLLVAFAAAVFRFQNIRRRRQSECCQISNILEFLLELATNVAWALLATVLLMLLLQATSLRTLKLLIYIAFWLQFLYLSVHLWRCSQLELFLIDWERPRSSCEGQRLNLDSSSLCSSVRTFVAESSVSAWRVLFTANAWIRLSVAQKYSSLVQIVVVIAAYQLWDRYTHKELALRCCLISVSYLIAYLLQLLTQRMFVGNPLQKFIDLCSLANISLFTLKEPGFGYYIHGRSPHGFADTDMSSMILQLQREAQNMCGRRGLLMDSDKQAYVILPPRNLRIYLDRLLLPFQRSAHGSMSQTLLYQKDIPSIDGQVERTSIAYASVNRFFCAFIDHAIKDMDYIIKEKSVAEKLFNCEIENYLTENKGTFYIDDSYSFSRLLLLGNHMDIFVLEILLLLSLFLLSGNLLISAAAACGFNMLIRHIFRFWVRRNVSRKTLIDERFLL